MTKPLSEPSNEKDIQNHAFRIRQLERRPGQASRAAFLIKVFSDTTVVTVGDGKFIFAIPIDVGGYNLVHVEAWVTTVSSSGIVRCQIRNISQAQDMLSTRVQVDASEFHSDTAAVQPVIDLLNDDVVYTNRIAIDVDDAGTGAKGLGVSLIFGPATAP